LLKDKVAVSLESYDLVTNRYGTNR
jgi:hypothetical protein